MTSLLSNIKLDGVSAVIGVLASIGCLVLLRFALLFLRFFYRTFLRPGTNYKKYGAGHDYWAVVTGASDGIGKDYALQLAQKGFNVVLVSRTESKLEAVAKQIEDTTQASTKIVTMDLSDATEEDWVSFEDAIEGLSIGVLVNNAGMSNELPQKYLEDIDRARDIVELNVAVVNEMTATVLPHMLHNKSKGKRGLIINVSSFSSLIPTPYLAVYAASKSFVNSFSAALAAEYEDDGIDVDCPIPFFVCSNLSKRRRPTWNCPLPGPYVKASLNAAGHGDWMAWSPYWSHSFMEFMLQFIPLPTLSNAQFDCQTLVCDPCSQGATKVDFIFTIDGSGSMENNMRGTGNGLTALGNAILERDIDALFFINLYGFSGGSYCDNFNQYMGSELLLNGGNVSYAQSIFAVMTAAPNPPPQLNGVQLHVIHGGYENGWEAAQMALHIAGSSQVGDGQFNMSSLNQPEVPCTNCLTALRNDSIKFLVLVTDEPNHGGQFAANRPPGVTCASQGTTSTYGDESTGWGLWYKMVADGLEQLDAIVYNFINPNTKSRYDYGYPFCDASDPDYTNWDLEATLSCLQQNNYNSSMQSKLLHRGIRNRVFHIDILEDAGNGNTEVIDAIMVEAAETISQCTAKRKREIQCYDYSCSTAVGCVTTPLCDSEVCGHCLIDGICYKNYEKHPTENCKFCQSAINSTAWTTCGVDVDACTTSQCSADFQTCDWKVPICNAACNRCDLSASGGTCLANGAKNPLNFCQICNATNNDQAYSEICQCAGECLNNGICAPDPFAPAIGYCQCDGNLFHGEFCEIPGPAHVVCNPPCLNGGLCAIEQSTPTCVCNQSFAGAQCEVSLIKEAPEEEPPTGLSLVVWICIIVGSIICGVIVIGFTIFLILRSRRRNASATHRWGMRSGKHSGKHSERSSGRLSRTSRQDSFRHKRLSLGRNEPPKLNYLAELDEI